MKTKKENNSDVKNDDATMCGRRVSGRILAGAIVLIVGFGLLFRNMFGWSFNYFWPLTIIAVGLFIIFKRIRNE